MFLGSSEFTLFHFKQPSVGGKGPHDCHRQPSQFPSSSNTPKQRSDNYTCVKKQSLTKMPFTCCRNQQPSGYEMRLCIKQPLLYNLSQMTPI